MCPAAKICGGAFLFMKFFKDNGLNVFFDENACIVFIEKKLRPSSVRFTDSFPPRGSL